MSTYEGDVHWLLLLLVSGRAEVVALILLVTEAMHISHYIYLGFLLKFNIQYIYYAQDILEGEGEHILYGQAEGDIQKSGEAP